MGNLLQMRITGPNAQLTWDRHLSKLAKHPGDAGIDLYPAVTEGSLINQQHTAFGQIWTVPLGVNVLVPEGHFGLIVGRSSSMSKLMGCTVVQSVIDYGYTGPLFANFIVPIEHGGDRPYTIALMERLCEYTEKQQAIAQMLVLPCLPVSLVRVDFLPKTERGDNGYGSTDERCTVEHVP